MTQASSSFESEEGVAKKKSAMETISGAIKDSFMSPKSLKVERSQNPKAPPKKKEIMVETVLDEEEATDRGVSEVGGDQSEAQSTSSASGDASASSATKGGDPTGTKGNGNSSPEGGNTSGNGTPPDKENPGTPHGNGGPPGNGPPPYNPYNGTPYSWNTTVDDKFRFKPDKPSMGVVIETKDGFRAATGG